MNDNAPQVMSVKSQIQALEEQLHIERKDYRIIQNIEISRFIRLIIYL